MKPFAPGIQDKNVYGDLNKIHEGDILDLVIQKHLARKAGPHRDVRMGTPSMGLFSAATKKPLPGPGEKTVLHQTQLHNYGYKDFEGKIGSGYGSGSVSKEMEGKLLITKVTDNAIHVSTVHGQNPKRYALVKPREGSKSWLLVHGKSPEHPGVEKPQFESIPEDKLEERLHRLNAEDFVQAKIDGALNMIRFGKGKAEVMSYRESKKHPDEPIIHTERFFKGNPSVKYPSKYEDTVAMGEVFGTRKGKPIALQELGALLNSNIEGSIKKQRAQGIELKTQLFDIAKLKGQPTTATYPEKMKMLQELIKDLPREKFMLPDSTHGYQGAKTMLDKIKSKEHPLTEEGLVIHTPMGAPEKYKLRQEANVYIKNVTQGNNKYEGTHAGGFSYSLEPGGPEVGKVGSGLSDELRALLLKSPEQFSGRKASIYSTKQLPSGAWFQPSLKSVEE